MKKRLVRMSWPGLLFAVIVVLINTQARAQGDVASLYKAKCAACHGADGKGGTATGKKLGARDFASPEV